MLDDITKSQEEGRNKVGSESLWERRVKPRWIESVLYFYMTAHMVLSFGLLLLTSSK